MPDTKHCAHCNTTKPIADFGMRLSRHGKPIVRWICKSCRSRYAASKYVNKYVKKFLPDTVVICANCSAEFTTSDYRRKYCSTECYRAANRPTSKPRITYQYIKLCTICGEVFLGKRSYKFCSSKCKGE